MLNVTWRRFGQSVNQLVVGQTTTNFCNFSAEMLLRNNATKRCIIFPHLTQLMPAQPTSHAHTVVWECCKDDQQSQWEMLKFDPHLPLNPLSDRHQIWRAWLRDGYLSPRKNENWAQSVKGFLLPIYAKYTSPCSLRYATLRTPMFACLLLFWSFQSPTAETPAWILTLKTSNDAVLRKEVPFGSYKSEITYLTEF